MSHDTGTYQKDDQTRFARTPATAVALAFDGWVRVGDLPDDVDEGERSTEQPAQPDVTPGVPSPLDMPSKNVQED